MNKLPSHQVQCLAFIRHCLAIPILHTLGFILPFLLLISCSDPQQSSSLPSTTQTQTGVKTEAVVTSADSCRDPKTIVHADIVALEQAYLLNRFAAYVPGGMLFALRSDVRSTESDDPKAELIPGKVRLRDDKRPRPLVLRVNKGECLEIKFQNLLNPEWTEFGGIPRAYDTKRPDGSVESRLPQHVEANAAPAEVSRHLVNANQVSKDLPRTRAAAFHVNGLEYAAIPASDCPKDFVCGGGASNVGFSAKQGLIFNPDTSTAKQAQLKQLGSLVAPGDHAMLRLYGETEGTYFAYSTAAPVGGEGDGGQIGLGLFGAVNVEPAASKWFRSQVKNEDLQQAVKAPGQFHPYSELDYQRFATLDEQRNIVHSDLNAIIVQKEAQPGSKEEEQQLANCKQKVFGDSCGLSFREFTVIMHDEVHAEQAFAELDEEDNPLHYLKDGMGINYGVSSMGSLLMGGQAQRKVGVVAKCPECRAEEFFLSSWANGDPALILKWDEQGEKPIGALYPDDPSNVHHSYLGDPVRFRNLHAGPKETHVFHLHAHQWVLDNNDKNQPYLDSQTISPGATFSYGIEFGGSGNRNYTPGDSIFHCHLYPHFAQGMWELWRTHDVFEDGNHEGVYDRTKAAGPDNNPRWRKYPDAEVVAGIESPALVPIPGAVLAPIPTETFAGYPFYIAAEAGHRPPQPPLDMDVNDPDYDAASGVEPDSTKIVNGGLPRHYLTEKTPEGQPLPSLSSLKSPSLKANDPVIEDALEKGGKAAQLIARRVYAQNENAVSALARNWEQLYIKTLQHSGEASEKAAMAFHAGELADDSPTGARRQLVDNAKLSPAENTVAQHHRQWWTSDKAYLTASAAVIKDLQHERDQNKSYFHVNGLKPAAGAPYANPCPNEAPLRHYRSAFIQTELTVNKHGWFDPQGRIEVLENDIKDIIDPNTRARLPEPFFFRANSGECIDFKSTNLIPSALNADDFQIYTPTDTIGQHIHLVKFDVTASDGSGNGWNYEDGTFSPDEVRERIFAVNQTQGDKKLKPKVHPLFLPGGDIYEHKTDPRYQKLFQQGQCPEQKSGEKDAVYQHRLNKEHPFCGAQRTTQRWWADPILIDQDAGKKKDNTLRTVFTHDHFGPSSHQQHGLYAGLVIEPANSTWENMINPKIKTDTRSLIAQASQCSDQLLMLRQNPTAKIDSANCKAVRASLMGGSDLSKQPLQGQTVPADHPLALIQPRPPLILRSDGGPTATMANIIAPECIGDPNSHNQQPTTGKIAMPSGPCRNVDKANQTRREFALAFADFAGVYNTALEPINPETRDTSARRFGERQVALQVPHPLAISSEDPGTQLINYRNEPLALRIAKIKANKNLGGFDYSQAPCTMGEHHCTGDMANALASHPHANRDLELATKSYANWTTPKGEKTLSTESLLSSASRDILIDAGVSLSEQKTVLTDIEQWRRDFNCALYPDNIKADQIPVKKQLCTRAANDPIANHEPWRVLGDPATPILAAYESDPIQIRLIQGSQEAQHIFAMNGVKWNRIPDNINSGFTNSQPLGISEHFEFNVVISHLDHELTDHLYYSTSIDQLWDGMWGVLRSFGQPHSEKDQNNRNSLLSLKRENFSGVSLLEQQPAEWLKPLPLQADNKHVSEFGQQHVCLPAATAAASTKVPYKIFNINVVQICQLYGDCAKPQGISYSKRFDIQDPFALAYVLSDKPIACNTDNVYAGCPGSDSDTPEPTNAEVLKTLQSQFSTGDRKLEPLVLRASAGQCLEINLRNHLPEKLADGIEKPEDYELRLLKANSTQDLPTTGNRLFILAQIGSARHLRIFDALGNQVIDKTETELMPDKQIKALKEQNFSTPTELSETAKQNLIKTLIRISGFKAQPEMSAYFNFLPMITDGFNLNQYRMSSTVGLSAPRVAQDPLYSDSTNIGLNATMLSAPPALGNHTADWLPGTLVPPCHDQNAADAKLCKRQYFWAARDFESKAPLELGALPLTSFADPIKHPTHGLIGALVIEPEKSIVVEEEQNNPKWQQALSAHIRTVDGKVFNEQVLVMQDAVSALHGGFPVGDLSGSDEPDDYGIKAINYHTEPLWARRGNDPSIDFGERNEQDYAQVFSSDLQNNNSCQAGIPFLEDLACEPETGVIQAKAGEALRLHIVHPGGHTRQQGLSLHGHAWNPYPWTEKSSKFDACEGSSIRQGTYNGFGPMMGISLEVTAGGQHQMPGEYLFHSQASFLLDGGLWNILRVSADTQLNPGATHQCPPKS